MIMLFVLSGTIAQDNNIFRNGILKGDFDQVEGSEKGVSISTKVEGEVLSIDFSGEESWGRVFLQLRDKAFEIKNKSYLVFTIKADTNLLLEEIGLGEKSTEGERLKKHKITSDWQTIYMEVPAPIKRVSTPLVIASIQKVNLQFREIYYTESIPESVSERTLVLKSSPYERIEDAKYVFSEATEFGAMSGYSGEHNGTSMLVDGHCMESPYRGKYCIKIEVDDKEYWRSLFLQATGKWTDQIPEGTKLESLEAYSKMVFYARSPTKDYIIPEVIFGESGGAYQQEKRNLLYVEVGEEWKRYELNIRGLNRTEVNTVMALVLREGILYLDEIRFEK